MSLKQFLDISLLLILPSTFALAEHGGAAAFESITAKYYGISQTPVRNAKITFGWAEDESKLMYQVTGDDGKPVTKSYDLKSGSDSVTQEKIPALKQPEIERKTRRAGYENSQTKDGSWEVIQRDGKVMLKDRKTNAETVLAADDADGRFGGNPYWSPDSKKFLLWKRKDVPVRKVQYVRSSPEKQLQPEQFTIDYPKPGDELATAVPWIFFTDGSAPMPAERSLIENPFEIKNAAWRADSARLTYDFIERGFGKMNVIEMNAVTRTQRVLIREESDTFVYAYGYGFRRDLRDGEEILWNSERDGWNHLYLFDGKTGEVKKQLTKGSWVVKKVVSVSEKKRQALVKVCGCYPTQDPYYEHYVTVHFDTGKVVPLTASPGQHEEPVFSPLGNYYVCRWSRMDKPWVYELRRTEDGKLLKTLSEADDRELRSKWKLPEAFVAKDREGKFDIFGLVILPPDFDPAKKYPVVECIYAGPQDAFTKKSWGPWLMPMHEVAVHGFIVVKIDGRGTAHRGKEFHHFCYKNLKDAGLPDRIAWMKAAAKKYPQMDLTRVGVFGGSAGGQNALGALLFHGDFYKAAAADCGCHDNRMDKIWWNEQWMDWPVGPHYADNSNVTHAKNLKGALLLTVGEVDTNVDPSSTMQVVNALIKADKDFDMMLVPNGNHGVGESRHMQRKRVDFFRRHLGGPISGS
jgi:dipeptidyl aminopeptidase/acylaminoacyl peptidase